MADLYAITLFQKPSGCRLDDKAVPRPIEPGYERNRLGKICAAYG
jgi:hypothetical protein